MKHSQEASINHRVLWFTVGLFVPFCAYVIMDRESAAKISADVLYYITNKLGWIYLLTNVGFTFVFIWLAFSKYGTRKLGEEKPEFSTITWLGMIFAVSGTASALVWSSCDAFFYAQLPPFGIEPFSHQAYEFIQPYSLMHSGPILYAPHSVMGIMYGYAMHVKKMDISRPSSLFQLSHGRALEDNWKNAAVDVLILFGLICGYGTSLGISTPLISNLLVHIFGVTPSIRVDAVILLAVTGLIAICLYTGLYKGIMWLSNFRVYLGYGLLVILFAIGPTAFMLNNFVDAVGILFSNIIRMSLYTDPHAGSANFPQVWTIFYCAWFILGAFFVGMYLARISRGRTVRLVLWGSLAASVLGNWVYFLVLQNYAIFLQKKGTLPYAEILAEQGTAAVAVATWSLYPMSEAFMVAFLILSYVAVTTFINGSVYTCAMMTSKNLTTSEQPGRSLRLIWAFIIGGIAIILLFIGGLEPIKTISVVGALPTVAIMLVMFYIFIKAIQRDNW